MRVFICLQIHDETYVNLFGNLSAGRLAKLDLRSAPVSSFTVLPCGGVGLDADTYFNEHYTSAACRTAVGCLVDLSCLVAVGELKNG